MPATCPTITRKPAGAPSLAGAPALALLAAAAVVVLAGCAGTPQPGRDGPDPTPPPGLASVPDAEPRIEPLRTGGPNKPYEVLGERYTPVATDQPMRETGLASWYGRKFHGRRTSNGEVYDMYAMTAAHKTMPLPSYARVRNPANGREVIVRVNDRGPFAHGRIIDLSYTAALKLDLLRRVAPVEVERLTHDEIRAGVAPRARALPAPAAPLPPTEPPPAEDPLMALVNASQAAATTPGPGYWLQLGAFRQRDGAALLQQQLQREADWLAPLLALVDEGSVVRLHAGPWATRAEALDIAGRLASMLSLTPLVLDRR